MSASFPAPFGRYQLVERLALGGMAELYRARVVGAHGFQKPVVIKKILPHLAGDPSFVKMFIDEAKFTAMLDHPKIAQVLELGTIDNQLYIAMEFVDGLDVLALLRACAHKKETLPAPLAVHIAHEVLDALSYAHEVRSDDGQLLGIVHRDISPSNVLVSRRGDVKLADFGIAHAIAHQVKNKSGTLKGKYGYMSPEQVVGGEIDGRSDLFSVGIVLAEMLMGRRLFTAPNELDVLLMVRDVRLDRLEKYGKHIPVDLREILLSALRRDPRDRPASAGEMRDTLAEWLFEKRQRVTPADLAGLVEELCGVPPLPAHNDAGVPASVEPVPRPITATLVGPETKAREIEAHEMARAGREEAARRSQEIARRTIAELVEPPALEPPALEPPFELVSRSDETIPIVVDLEQVEGEPSGEIIELGVSDQTTGRRPQLETPVEAEGELDLSELSLDLEIDEAAARRVEPSELMPEGFIVEPPPPPPRLGGLIEYPDDEGALSSIPPIRTLYKLAVDKATGLLVVEVGTANTITKEIYFVNGTPEFVASNVSRELLGEYLVNQKVISPGELAMALAMMPHFGGKLGDTLVGLGLMKPLDVFRQLTRQVREKIIDVCTWPRGYFRWYRGKRNSREAFPLGLDAFEVLGAGASALPVEMVEAWWQPLAERTPLAAKNPRVVPEAFRLGAFPRDIYNKLDGRYSLRELLGRFTGKEDRMAFLRTLYLLVQTDLAYWTL